MYPIDKPDFTPCITKIIYGKKKKKTFIRTVILTFPISSTTY